MRKYPRFTLTAALWIAVLEALDVVPAAAAAQAAPVAPCAMRLRVELTPEVPYPREPGFISSLLGNHPDYRLILERQDPEDSSVIALDLTGPGSEADCREVVTSMRKDARVRSVEVERDALNTALTGNTAQPLGGFQPATPVQPVGTVHAGVDGDWVVEPLNGASYAQEARDRYLRLLASRAVATS